MGPDPELRWRRSGRGRLVQALVSFGVAQGWVVSRPAAPPLTGRSLVDLAAAIGIAARVGERVVLDEALFVRLQEDPEARLVYDALQPLQDRMTAWLQTST